MLSDASLLMPRFSSVAEKEKTKGGGERIVLARHLF